MTHVMYNYGSLVSNQLCMYTIANYKHDKDLSCCYGKEMDMSALVKVQITMQVLNLLIL